MNSSVTEEVQDSEMDLELFEDTDERRLFYKLTLSIKLRFSSSAPLHYISISDLYDKARTKNVPKSHWKEFIT
jgi:hypothetical protein